MNNLKRDVCVSVYTVQKDEDGKSEIKASYDGVMYLKSGIYYIFYTEYSEDGEQTAQCRIKCSKGEVEIRREGSYSSRLCFEAGKTYKTVYNTPYGTMPVSIKAKTVVVAVDENGGKILLDYSMSLAGKDFQNNVTIALEV